ncbi:MAG TPA: sodium:solute symporter family protein [Dehalococcoidales bacterium]|nr:sodium:solute symporter family protein [Dehalococcoidales bacterium]
MLPLVVIILYFAAVIAIGVTSFKRHWRLDEYLAAGRKYSTFFIAGALLATIIGGSATIGLAGLGYSRGLSGAWWLLVGVIGLVILGFFFARKVRNYGLYTLPELITRQYDRRAGTAASIVIVIAWIAVTAGQILAAGKILSALDFGSPFLWMLVFSFIFIGYTILGGQYAIVRTDILDIVILFTGLFLVSGIVVNQIGGIDVLWQALPADKLAFPLSSKFSLTDLVSYLLLIGLTYVVGPDMYARLFCARDGQTARRATFWAAGVLVPFAFCIILIGMGAFYLFPNISPEAAFPTLITDTLPPWAAGLLLAALISAVMSSASATLWSASTTLSVNLVRPFQKDGNEIKTLRLSRLGMLLIGVAALLLALVLKSVISALLLAYTIYTCGVIMPVILGFFRERLKLTSNAALAAIIGGGLTGLVSKLGVTTFRLDLAALGVCLFLLFAVSYLDNRRSGWKKETDKTSS